MTTDRSTDPTAPSLIPEAPPLVSEADAERIAAAHFGVSGAARSLGSHEDRNFLLDTGTERLLLKVANPATSIEEVTAQSAAAAHLAERAPGVRAPRARTTTDGAPVAQVAHEGTVLHVRLLDFLDGGTLSGSGHLAPSVVDALGDLAARVDLALSDFEAPGVERPHQWDLRQSRSVLPELFDHLDDPALRSRLEAITHRAWEALAPLEDDLPVQAVHGDLTDDNVVWSDPVRRTPDGVIDLGDLNRSWPVGGLAITFSSLLHHDGVDITTAVRALRAYHRRRPLSSAEASAFWPLVVLRAVHLVASGHHVVSREPDNAYAAENLVHEEAILAAAVSVPLPVATRLVRSALGFPSAAAECPAALPLLPEIDADSVIVLDLSAASVDVEDGAWLDPALEERLARGALAADSRAAITRFGEARVTRATRHAQQAPATVATGIDVTLDRPATLVAPWNGRLSRDDAGLVLRGDGEAAGIRLELGAASAEGGPLAEAAENERQVGRGEAIGTATHGLTVRVVRESDDSVDEGARVPAFVTPAWADAWRAMVADPSPLLPGHPSPAERDDPAALLARRNRVFAEVQEHYYDAPPIIARGWKQYLIDTDGRVYLDMVNNVTALGHAHPRIAAAANRQLRTLNTNSRFHYPAVVEYAERLTELTPEPLDTVFLVNSGSEAVDLALRLARAATGRRDVLAVREAYHGWTDLADAVSTSVADNPAALATRPDWVHTVDAPNSFRGVHRDEEAVRYAPEAVAEIERLAAQGHAPGAFVAETFFGNAGGVALPEGYLDAVYAAIRAHGGLAVADEVQVGFGRLGEWFWGFEQQGVVPDIVTVAKAVGNGHPLGAVITTREIAAAYRREGYFFASTGGSPLSSVIGSTVLDVIRDEGLQENARTVGAYLRAQVLGLAHPLVGAVHGSGLYLGIELVRDPVTREPATEETAAVCDRMRELGVIVQPTGDHQNVLKIKPPLCLEPADVDAFVRAFARALEGR
ncbi:aminotransferase [Microbacterium sp. TNHR37B]|uniref:aminotransferase n=1 Tax=Microbacterium sp. TNHR37B TaxID=1775956 RepID=UPI0007B2AB64|nr:aminotransferase [Microbacterium sp. TNHR37B]KZE88553.1 2,2-dialkylglycine decarboxylase [Microbacterium sp. TNHR37B]